MVREGIGAGDGIRTRDFEFGKLAHNRLCFARSGCRLQPSFKRSKPVTVRADDIALRGLCQHPIDRAHDHSSDARDLGRWVAVVEIHGALRKRAAAIGARHRPQLIKQVRSVSPPLALFRDARRNGGRAAREPGSVLLARSEAVAVRADDVALRRLGEQRLTALEHRPAGRQHKLFFALVAMVEIHLVRLKAPTAIHARNLTKTPEEGRCLRLSPSNSLDLSVPIRCVVGHIEWALIADLGHAPF